MNMDNEQVSKELLQHLIARALGELSEIALDHALNPRNLGHLQNPHGKAIYQDPEGESMAITLKIKNGSISEIRFWTDGCGSSICCGSMASELAKGSNIVDAERIDQNTILKALGGLPKEQEHCALLAATCLKMALNDYLNYNYNHFH